MKFIDSHVYKEIRMSEVIIEHKGEEFVGFAVCHPDDTWSDYIGCKFAELRATLKALKYEYQIEKEKVNEIQKFIAIVEQYKNFNKEDGTAKAMYRQLNRRLKNLKAIEEDINMVKKTIKARLKALEKTNQILKDKKS